MGSHHLGRVDHIRIGDQMGADPQRVDWAKPIFPLFYVEVIILIKVIVRDLDRQYISQIGTTESYFAVYYTADKIF